MNKIRINPSCPNTVLFTPRAKELTGQDKELQKIVFKLTDEGYEVKAYYGLFRLEENTATVLCPILKSEF